MASTVTENNVAVHVCATSGEPVDVFLTKAWPQDLKWWHPSYGFDWLLSSCTALLAGLLYIFVSPHKRPIPSVCEHLNFTIPSSGDVIDFPCDQLFNVNHNYPNRASSVPGVYLIVLDLILPLFIAGLSAFLCFRKARTTLWHDFHHFTLGLQTGFWLGFLWLVVVLKIVGKPRPYVLDGGAFPTQNDEFHSFPSGHASTVFTALTHTSLFLAGKTGLFSPRGGQFWKLLLVNVPILIAMWVASTRIRDFKHAEPDVIAGALVGVASGVFGYFSVYPSLMIENCHLPKSRNFCEATQEVTGQVRTFNPQAGL